MDHKVTCTVHPDAIFIQKHCNCWHAEALKMLTPQNEAMHTMSCFFVYDAQPFCCCALSMKLWNQVACQLMLTCAFLQMVAYQGRIQHHMNQLAMNPAKEQFAQTLQPEAEGIDLAKLFDAAADAQQTSSAHMAVLDDMAHQLGTAGKSVISEWAPGVSNAAMAAASRQWSSYWRPANASS